MKAVGARLPRYDGVAHVTGRTQYVDDIRVRGTLWTKALRSPHPHAAIKNLDTSKAEALSGVRAIVTHKDVPKNVYGHLEALGIPADEPLLAVDEVRYKGQPIAAVAADDEDIAREAVALIEIEYEEREPFFDMRKAMDSDWPNIHQWGPVYPHFGPHNHRRVRKGDIDAAFDKADAVTSDGWILGRRMTTLHDAGAYARFSPYGVTKHAFHHTGAYTIPNVHFDGFVVFTNRVPTTAMRGFGVTSVSFAVETQMNRMAEVLGLDPLQIRLKNANRIGDTTANRVVLKDPSTVPVVLAAADRVGYDLPAEYKSMTNAPRSRDLLPEHLARQVASTNGGEA